MGCWDCYCAICGGPFWGVKISEKPRSAVFRKRRAKGVENQRLGREGACEGDHEAEDDDDERDPEEACEEDHSYDPDVISDEDVEWTETLHVLASNPESEEELNAFVSGPGTYADYGRVSVESGDDPYAEGVNLDELYCYGDIDFDSIFPFHWCCYEILTKCLTGSFDDSSLDKDLLFSVMDDMSAFCGGDYSLSGVDWGEIANMQSQFWESVPGYEFVVSHPRKVPGANEAVLSMFASDFFKPKSSCTHLGSRVRNDPFVRIPYDIIHSISTFISDEELVNLAKASWPIHVLLRNNNQFWCQRIRKSLFPWFFELQELLEQDQTLLQTNDAQRIFQWAEKMTRPKKWLTGPLMGVANRRRIWSACEQLGGKYWPQKEEEGDVFMSDEEKLIQQYSEFMPLVTLSSPAATTSKPAREVYWVKSWSEVRSQTKTLETFWDRHGSLVGISLTPDGQKRRLVGLDSSDDGLARESTRLGPEEWVKGLIVHMPDPTHFYMDHSQLVTTPKGLTIILDSGRTSVMGDKSQFHMQRSLLAAPDWCITGINGATGLFMGDRRLKQLGLIQAQHPDVTDHSVPPPQIALPLPTPLGQLLWDEDYSQVLGQSIQEHPMLRLVGSRSQDRTNGHLHKDLISHGALIWAKDAVELQSLRRLTGCIISGGKADIQCLCGVNAEYEPTTDLPRREIGAEKTGTGRGGKVPDLFEWFDIDGPGGEVVTELEIPVQTYPKALKVHTNWGQICTWGDAGVQTWDSIKAPTGETLVGIVVKFGGLDRCADDADWEGLGRYRMSVVAGLSMRLEN